MLRRSIFYEYRHCISKIKDCSIRSNYYINLSPTCICSQNLLKNTPLISETDVLCYGETQCLVCTYIICFESILRNFNYPRNVLSTPTINAWYADKLRLKYSKKIQIPDVNELFKIKRKF